ncbi:MAG: energy-coupling factor ABC transporter ATP-binding protein [Lachnospiraceae bacterium]|nr:energy-coupling factor ABC transporter ATP-binding protein [Lachnospiraceae bacterium]
MIDFNDVSFEYKSAGADGTRVETGGVSNINLKIKKGEFVVITGESGCGKTTLIRLINGLIPGYYNGELKGTVTVLGKSVKDTPIQELSGIVGSVFQNPRSQFFNINTTDEIAFAAENQRRDPEKIRNGIAQTAKLLNIERLLDRNIFELSGGEKQIIACAGIDVLSPDVVVLDEPSSNLDRKAIEHLAVILGKWKEEGKTIVIAEHRIFYLKDLADRMLVMKDGKITEEMDAERLKNMSYEDTCDRGLRCLSLSDLPFDKSVISGGETIEFRDFCFTYKDKKHSINIPELEVPQNSIIAIIGDNGAGKSTLARNLCGLEKKCKGTIIYGGRKLGYRERRHSSYMVMQDVNHQLFTESVGDEVILSMASKKASDEEKDGKAKEILDSLDLGRYMEIHPMALSGGQKQRTALASAIASDKPIIVMDEPTSGLDYHHMIQVAKQIEKLKAMGRTVFIVTHDYEFIWRCCDFIVHLKNGKVARSYEIGSDTAEKLKNSLFGGEQYV